MYNNIYKTKMNCIETIEDKKERKRAYFREYYIANKSKLAEKRLEWQRNNAEHLREYRQNMGFNEKYGKEYQCARYQIPEIKKRKLIANKKWLSVEENAERNKQYKRDYYAKRKIDKQQQHQNMIQIESIVTIIENKDELPNE